MIFTMHQDDFYDHILIRDASVLVRTPRGQDKLELEASAELFDVRTGVPLKQIYPPLESSELGRGYRVSTYSAAAIISGGAPFGAELEENPSKIVNIMDLRQRRLDSVVSESILEQLRVISDLLSKFLDVAEGASKEERFWLSQQVLPILKKFSGRELNELEEIVEWLRRRPRK